MTILTVTGLIASFGTHRVLHGVDLAVEAGTTMAVLGPSGCGKTTLLRAIAGFVAPDEGQVRLDDRVIVGPGVKVAPERRGIGYVAQEGALFPHLEVAANIAFGLPRRQRRVKSRIAELLELVSLDASVARRRPHELSGGQQQRVALARALARNPGLVLLDEPFSALDAALRTSTRRAVAAALAHSKVTVVLVTHDQSEALSFAGQLAIMRDGRIIQVGSPESVYQNPVDRETSRFLGEALFLPGMVDADTVTCALGSIRVREPFPTGPAEVMLRPEQLEVCPVREGHPIALVRSVSYFGHDALVEARLVDGGGVVTVRVQAGSVPDVGTRIALRARGTARVFPPPEVAPVQPDERPGGPNSRKQ